MSKRKTAMAVKNKIANTKTSVIQIIIELLNNYTTYYNYTIC